jgi:putative FmdB family regulatory protein
VPRYDYRCTVCDNTFELVQSFKEAGKGACPECQGAGQRLYHAVPVIYKGSGFYTTDYGRPKPPVENGSKPDSDDKSTKTESTETATKSETKESAKETASASASSSETPAATSSA